MITRTTIFRSAFWCAAALLLSACATLNQSNQSNQAKNISNARASILTHHHLSNLQYPDCIRCGYGRLSG